MALVLVLRAMQLTWRYQAACQRAVGHGVIVHASGEQPPKPSPLSKLLPLGEGPMLLQKAARHPSLRIIQWGRRGPTEGNCLFLQPPSASRSRSAWPAVRQQSARPAVSRCRCLGPGQSVHHCSAGVTILGRLF